MAAKKLLSMDVTGTLLHVRGSVGAHYARHLKDRVGITADEQSLNTAFKRAFVDTARTLPCFGARSGLSCEDWWRKVVSVTLTRTLPAGSVTPELVDVIFPPMYRDFACPSSWEKTPGCDEALDCIDKWRKDVGHAVILSNFDPRLHPILQGLDITKHFDNVFISSEIGWEKPERGAFDYVHSKMIGKGSASSKTSGAGGVGLKSPASSQQHRASSTASSSSALSQLHTTCVHVGDSEVDVRGAVAAGWAAVGIGGKPNVSGIPHTAHLHSVAELPRALKALGFL